MSSMGAHRQKTLRGKLGVSFALVAIALSAMLSVSFFLFFRHELRNDFRERLITAVSIAALQVDGEQHSRIQSPDDEKGEAYRQIKATLQRIRKAAGGQIRFVYTMRLLPDNSLVYVTDAEPEDSKDFSKIGDPVTNIGPLFKEFWRKGGGPPYAEKEFLTDSFGTWLSGNAMLYRADGSPDAVLAMDISAESVLARERTFLWLIFGLFICTIPLALLMGWLKGRSLAAPITQLTEEVESFDEERLDRMAKDDGDDETGDLARAFNRMTQRIRDLLDNLQMEILERRRVQEKLGEAEHKFMDMLYSSDHAMLLVRRGRFVDANDAASRIFGYASRQALIPADPAILSPPRQPDGTVSSEKFARMCSVASEKGTHRFEWQLQRFQGQLFTADISLTSMILEGQECLCTVIRDITESKRIEEARKKHEDLLESLVKERTAKLIATNEELRSEIVRRAEIEKELEKQREFLRLVLDSCPDLIFIKNSEGRFSLVNRAMAELYCVPAEKMIGHLDSEFVASPEDMAAVRRGDLETLNSLLPVMIEERVTLPESKEVRWYQSIKVPFSTLDGQRQVLGVAMDISDRKKSEAQLREAKDAAEAAARAKAEFLANMSHEIRTPLNAVLGISALLSATRLSHEQKEHVRMVRSSAETLLQTINEILDFSQMESAKLKLETLPFNVADCVEEVFDLVSTRAAEKKLELIHEVPPHADCIVLGDHIRFRQILMNLVGNAVKFTDGGEVTVSIRIETCDGEPWLSVSVSDTGIGIPEDKLDCLFKSFSQVDASISRKYGGSGLGLAICSRLVTLMDGRIWVKSNQGQGAVFSFSIPHKPAPALAAPPDEEALHEELAGHSAVIICRSSTFAASLARTCADLGLEVLRSGSGSDTLSADLPRPEFLIGDADLLSESQFRPMLHGLPRLLFTRLGEPKPRHLDRSARTLITEKPIRRLRLARSILAILNQDASLSQESDASPGGTEPLKNDLRILVAEDNLINQKVTLAMLEMLGYNAELAKNGLEVLAALRRQDYDFILMDIQMPGLDGMETARIISDALSGEQRPFIIALTAHDLASEAKRCAEVGMDDCLAKPLNTDDFQASVSRLLATRSNRPQSLAKPLISLNVLRRHEEIREGFAMELGSIFSTDVANGLDALSKLVADADFDKARDLVHGLKGASSSFGALAFAELCAEFQAKALQHDGDALKDLLPALRDCFERSCRTLEALRFPQP